MMTFKEYFYQTAFDPTRLYEERVLAMEVVKFLEKEKEWWRPVVIDCPVYVDNSTGT